MDTTRAATTHDQQTSPTPTRQMAQGGTYGRRQPEPVSESSPPLHRYLGNSYVQAMIAQKQRVGLQTKLTVNEPGDIYEQEADQIADQVMAAPTHVNISIAPLQIQRFAEPSPGQGDTAPASVAQTLASPGSPLEPILRQDMEQRFGHDFSAVRVHTDAAAEQSARDVKARAYTMGHHIVFGAGRFAPETTEGRRLIAHELTHVAQMSAFGSPPGITAGLWLPILRQPESGADVDEKERRRRKFYSIAKMGAIPPVSRIGEANIPELIRWAEEQQLKFEDPELTDEERCYIAVGLLRALRGLREYEGQAKRDHDDALVYTEGGELKLWTQDRARKLDDIAPFTAANIAEWRKAEAWEPSVTVHGKQPPKKKTPPRETPLPEQPTELPERRRFVVDVTFPKEEGMTFKTEEGQRRIASLLIASTRPGLTGEQIAWAISRIDLGKWWAPPGNLTLHDWQKKFEETAIGDKVTMVVGANFERELADVLLYVPSPDDFNLEGVRQGFLGARTMTYGAYTPVFALMLGTTIGSGLALLPGTGAVGGGGLTTGSGGLLAGSKGSLLLGETIRQSALYTGRYLYLNAPRLFGDAMLYTGAGLSGIALGEHLREVRSRGARWSDLPRLAQDLGPFFMGYSEWRSFRGGGPQSPGKEPPRASVPPPTVPPVASPKPIPAAMRGAALPPDAPPTLIGPAGAAKNPPISLSRRDLIQGPFPAPSAQPVAPVPAQPPLPPVGAPAAGKSAPPAPVGPPTLWSRLRWRLYERWLAHAIEGAEFSKALPRNIGAGGPSVGAQSTPAVTAKATPSPAAPTPDLPPQTPAQSKVIGPPKIAGAVVTPAPVTPASPAAPGHTVGTRAPAPKPVGTTPQALSFGWLLPRLLAPQPANQNDRSAAQKRADAKWQPQTQPQQQVQETPLAATGTDVVASVKVIASSGTQQDASQVHIVASREGAPPGRGAPVVGAVQAASGPTAPSPVQAPGATPSSRTEFDDNDPTDPEALPFGATQTPMTSLESLLSFLRDVWLLEHTIRQLGETEGVEAVYKLYSDSAQWQLGPTWSTEQNRAYLDSLKRLREDLGVVQLTGNAQAMGQQFKALEEEAARSGAQRVKYSIQQGREAIGFLHFYNVPLAPQGDSRVANERIYLSLKAEAALEVMRFVTRELVYNPQMAGITGAKIAGPQKVGQRGDAIVIYGEDLPSIQRALDRIAEYQRLHPHHFVDSSMPMAQPISKGVSVGSEPAASFGGVSFGKLRAKAIYEALKQATSLHDFLKRVWESFRSRRIDPERPHLNLP